MAGDEAGHDNGAASADGPVASALAVLVRYIPTEVVAIYIACLAIFGSLSADPVPPASPPVGQEAPAAVEPTEEAGLSLLELDRLTSTIDGWLWIVCLILCVFFVWVAWRAEGKKVPTFGFPWWTLVASLISFVAWSFAVPGNRLVTEADALLIWGVIALVLSYVLNGIERAIPDAWLGGPKV